MIQLDTDTIFIQDNRENVCINENKQRKTTLMNQEISEILKREAIFKAVKTQILRWYGYVNSDKKKKEVDVKGNRLRRPKIKQEEQITRYIKSLRIIMGRE